MHIVLTRMHIGGFYVILVSSIWKYFVCVRSYGGEIIHHRDAHIITLIWMESIQISSLVRRATSHLASVWALATSSEYLFFGQRIILADYRSMMNNFPTIWSDTHKILPQRQSVEVSCVCQIIWWGDYSSSRCTHQLKFSSILFVLLY